MEYNDKRLIGDTHEKEWIVSLINGDTETHYVQPVIREAVYSNKHTAMEEMRRIVNAILRSYPSCYIDERSDRADLTEIKIEGEHEYWITTRCVVKHGYIDLSDELGFTKNVNQDNKTSLVTVSYDEDAVEEEWMSYIYNSSRYNEEDEYEAWLNLYDLYCLDLEDKITKTHRRYNFMLSEKDRRYI